MLIESRTRIQNEDAASAAENMPHTCDPLANAKFTREDVDIEHVTYDIKYSVLSKIFDSQCKVRFKCENACNMCVRNSALSNISIIFSQINLSTSPFLKRERKNCYRYENFYSVFSLIFLK